MGKGDTCCDYNWTDGSGGSGSDSASGSLAGYSNGVQIDSSWSWTSQQIWPPSPWPFPVPGTQTASGDYDWPNFDPNISPPSIYLEHCNISFPINTIVSGALRPFYETYLYWDSTENYCYTRVADVQYMLETGGKGVPGRRDLWNLSASATQWIPRAEGPKSVVFDPHPISSQSIIIDGMRLDSGGQMWRTYAQHVTRDVTIHVPGVDYFTFTLVPLKYPSHIEVFVRQPFPDYPNDLSSWGLEGAPLGYPVYDIVTKSAGHAWWKLDNDAPIEVLNRFTTPDCSRWVNQAVGYGPVTATLISSFPPVKEGPGQLWTDNGSGCDVHRTYVIGFQGPGLIDALNYTQSLSNSPGVWNSATNNCVHKVRSAAHAAGKQLPTDHSSPEFFGFAVPPDDP